MKISRAKGVRMLVCMLRVIVQHVGDIFYVPSHNVNHQSFPLHYAFDFQ
jgi:hypothetical protein